MREFSLKPAAEAGRLQAVLWDMDGTVVDTEPYWFAAEHELCDAFGLPWTTEQSEQLIGNALPNYVTVLQRTGVELDGHDIIQRLITSVTDQVRQAVPWRPGARELLAQLREADIVCGLVTMSEAALADEVLAHLPADTFSVRVTGETVARGKPAPDPYLKGFRLLAQHYNGASPLRLDRTIAIEDSVTGVTSALAAGLATIGVPNIQPLTPLHGLTIWSTLDRSTVADVETVLSHRPMSRQAPDLSVGEQSVPVVG